MNKGKRRGGQGGQERGGEKEGKERRGKGRGEERGGKGKEGHGGQEREKGREGEGRRGEGRGRKGRGGEEREGKEKRRRKQMCIPKELWASPRSRVSWRCCTAAHITEAEALGGRMWNLSPLNSHAFTMTHFSMYMEQIQGVLQGLISLLLRS